jgi:nucleoside-diphosphate-sugar epimerase
VKYCITGGSGFIGGYFCQTLAAAGHELTILDLIDPPPGTPHHCYVKGDIRDADACREALRGCDGVLHLAAAHHDFGIEHDCYFSVNEAASQVLCDVMDELGLRSICFYSTVAVYGDAPEPHHEEAPCQPNSPYGASKLAGEAIFRTWTEKGDGRRCLVIRPTVTFGPRNFANRYTLIRQIHRGRYFIVGKGENIKSLSYIENIVDASLYLWDRSDLPAFDVYDYVEKPDMTSIRITQTVYEALGKKMPAFRFPMWLALLGALPFDIVIALTGKNLPISSARIRKMCSVQTKFEADKVLKAGFKPKVSLAEGIHRMVNWYVAEGKDQSADWHQPPTEIVKFES